MAIRYAIWMSNIPIIHEMPTFSIPRPIKITQIGNFGLKIFHLATALF
jgi:hypothetical protein